MNLRTQLNFCKMLICVIVALMSLIPRLGFAQNPTTEEWAFGYQAFNLLLQESGVKICSFKEYYRLPRSERFIISISPNGEGSGLRYNVRAPALVMRSKGRSLNAQFWPSLGLVPSNHPEDFYSTEFCPIVRPQSAHEVFFGVHELVCNSPGFLLPTSVRDADDDQLYPPTIGNGEQSDPLVERRFSAIFDEPTRRIWIADPQLFTNQMMFKADNLRFADNIVRWLSDDYKRTNVVLRIDGKVQQPVDPNDLDILTPIPTRDEVIQAMQQIQDLPLPNMMEFANTAMQWSEDENILNDMARQYTDGLQDGQINRLILFTIFACCCFFGLVTYFWQRRLLRRTASVTAGRRQRNLSKRGTDSGASERQAAASMLLNSFCLDVANRRLADWPEFPTPIISQHQSGPAVKATNEMADAFWRLRTKPKTYWTKNELAKLEAATEDWRQLLLNNRITIETES